MDMVELFSPLCPGIETAYAPRLPEGLSLTISITSDLDDGKKLGEVEPGERSPSDAFEIRLPVPEQAGGVKFVERRTCSSGASRERPRSYADGFARWEKISWNAGTPVLRRTSSEDSFTRRILDRKGDVEAPVYRLMNMVGAHAEVKTQSKTRQGPKFHLDNPNSTPAPLPLPAPRRKLNTALVQALRSRRTSPLDEALSGLTGDVVLIGGYRGSVLESASTFSPSGGTEGGARRRRRQLWPPPPDTAPPDLALGLCPDEDELEESHVVATALLRGLGRVDFAGGLVTKLRGCEAAREGKLRVWEWGYDWRLSPHLTSHRLVRFLQGLPCNTANNERVTGAVAGAGRTLGGALVIAHSLGGIMARHAANARPDLFSGIVYAGVPQSCVSALGPLHDGDPPGLAGHAVLDAETHFSLRTAYVFLPEDGECFVDEATGERRPVNFFDADEWVRHRLSPCVTPNKPVPVPGSMAAFGPLPTPPPSPRLLSNKPDGSFFEPGRLHMKKMKTATNVKPRHATRRRNTIHDVSMTKSPVTTRRERFPHCPTNKAYLGRVLASALRFRTELRHDPALSDGNLYPPVAAIYADATATPAGVRVPPLSSSSSSSPFSKTTSTTSTSTVVAAAPLAADLDVYGEARRVLAPGDGVVVADRALPPDGYRLVRDGKVRTDRGHMSLLSDLAAVGRAIGAVRRGREMGVGTGGRVGEDAFEA